MSRVAMIVFALLTSTAPLARADAAGGEPPVAPALRRLDERAPRPGTPLLTNKLHPMAGRFELSALFDYSLDDKYVEHTGGSAALAFHPFEYVAFEGFGGYLAGNDAGILEEARRRGFTNNRLDPALCPLVDCEPELPDRWMTTWFSGASVQWAPLYGKLSLWSDLEVSFQLYGLAGGGVEGITRSFDRDDDNDVVADRTDDTFRMRGSGHAGLGLRVMFLDWLALRAELRSFHGINPNVEEADAAEESECDAGYTMRAGQRTQCFTDFSQNTLGRVGVSFLF